MVIRAAGALLYSLAIAGSAAHAGPHGAQGARSASSEPVARSQDDGWVNLATATASDRGREWIAIDRYAGAFRTLRIDVAAGTVLVRRVTVEFHDGTSSRFDVDCYLTSRQPSAFIDFGAPRAIDRIFVMTARQPGGTYEVYGSWGKTQVDELVAAR